MGQRKAFSPNEGFKDSLNRQVHDVTVGIELKTQRVTLSTSPTPIPTTPLTNRQFVRVQNVSGVQIFIGGADVTSSNGWVVFPYAVETFAIEDTAVLYGCVASATADCIAMEGL